MKLPRLFRRLTPLELAASELADAEVALLAAHSGQEYAAAIIGYNQARIRRLRLFLASQPEEK